MLYPHVMKTEHQPPNFKHCKFHAAVHPFTPDLLGVNLFINSYLDRVNDALTSIYHFHCRR